MKKRCLATTVLLLLPAAAGAEQLEYGMRSGVGWTSNVFGTADNATFSQNGVLKDENPVDDYSVRLSPWGKVSDPDGDLTWSLRYQPSYEYYFQESGLRGFDNDAEGKISWRVGERTTLFASETYQQYRSLARFNENNAATSSTALSPQRDKIQSNLISLGMRHFFTPRDIWMVNGSYNLRDYSGQSSQDRGSSALGTSYQHNLTERTVIGASGSWIQQTYARQFGSDLSTNYYNISGTLEHHFSRTLSLEISAGPTLIDSDDQIVSFSPKFGTETLDFGGGTTTVGIDANTCPLQNTFLPHQPDPDLPNYNPHVSTTSFNNCIASSANTLTPGELDLLGYPTGGSPLVPGGSGIPQGAKLTDFSHPLREDSSGALVPFNESGVGGLDLTYFARVALTKDWELWHLELAYDRSNDDSGSFGVSSVQDSFEATVRWQPAELWNVALTGAYSMYDQANGAAVPTGVVVVENGPVPAGVDSMSQIATVQRLVVKSESNAVSYTSASVSLTASRRLTYNSSVFGALYWYRQDQNVNVPNDVSFSFDTASGGGDNTTDTLTLWLGLDWQFDTLKF